MTAIYQTLTVRVVATGEFGRFFQCSEDDTTSTIINITLDEIRKQYDINEDKDIGEIYLRTTSGIPEAGLDEYGKISEDNDIPLKAFIKAGRHIHVVYPQEYELHLSLMLSTKIRLIMAKYDEISLVSRRGTKNHNLEIIVIILDDNMLCISKPPYGDLNMICSNHIKIYVRKGDERVTLREIAKVALNKAFSRSGDDMKKLKGREVTAVDYGNSRRVNPFHLDTRLVDIMESDGVLLVVTGYCGQQECIYRD